MNGLTINKPLKIKGAGADKVTIEPVQSRTTLAGDQPYLRDGGGNKLYIPWGCSGGTCPQYAADVGNPAYRAWFIDQVRGYLRT